jgi:hypothetical protein
MTVCDLRYNYPQGDSSGNRRYQRLLFFLSALFSFFLSKNNLGIYWFLSIGAVDICRVTWFEPGALAPGVGHSAETVLMRYSYRTPIAPLSNRVYGGLAVGISST